MDQITLRRWRSDRSGVSHLADSPTKAACGAEIRPDQPADWNQCQECVLTWVVRREARRAGIDPAEIAH